MKGTIALALLTLTFCCGSTAHAVTFKWAVVDDPGNAPDTEVMIDGTTGYGSVGYKFRIAKHEVTNEQYTAFLNAVAKSDPNGLYNTSMESNTRAGITRSGLDGNYIYSVKPDAVGQGPGGTDYTYGNKPVVYVSYFDAMRFVNWLHNGQGAGDTETGVYNIGDGLNEIRSANAKYFIPSEDEWYKAAYYDPSGVYYDYPTGTDTVPDNNLPSADTGNSANFYDSGYTTGDGSYPMTDVGAYSLSASPYGTFDQGGNVWERNEGIFESFVRGLRAGAWYSIYIDLHASLRDGSGAAFESDFIGFRVASAIPEPSTLLLLCLGALGVAALRKRRGSR